jgi:DnaK suppressor protein
LSGRENLALSRSNKLAQNGSCYHEFHLGRVTREGKHPLNHLTRDNDTMSKELTPTQRDELKALLLARRAVLDQEMLQNQQNLAPPTADEGGMVQRNVAREVDQVLTNIDADDLVRIDRALKAMADGSYGICSECGCDIPIERLRVEPQTEHCVACKEKWEQATSKQKA